MAGPYSTTINWDTINTLTERNWLPGVQEQIFGTNTAFQEMYNSGSKEDGGTFLTGGVVYGEGPSGPYSGTTPLDLSIADIVTPYQYTWKQYYAGAAIAWLEELKNNGAAKLGSALETRMNIMEESMKQQLGRDLYHDGTDPLRITGLGAHVSTTTSIVVGGISASTNTWWRNIIVDMTGVPINTFKLRQARGLATQGSRRPNVLLTTQAIHDLYYATLQPMQRFTSPGKATGGFGNGDVSSDIAFEELPLQVDSHCPAGYLYMIYKDVFDFISHKMDNLKLWGWMSPHDQMFKTNKLTWTGNLVGKNRRFNVVMSGITQ